MFCMWWQRAERDKKISSLLLRLLLIRSHFVCMLIDWLDDLKKTPCRDRKSEEQEITETHTLGSCQLLLGHCLGHSWVEGVVLWERFWQFTEQITYTSPPLEDNGSASQLYTAGTYTYKQTNADRERINVCVCEDAFDHNYNTMQTPVFLWAQNSWRTCWQLLGQQDNAVE